MGKDQELLEAARNGNVPVVEKILGQRAKRSGPLARWVVLMLLLLNQQSTYLFVYTSSPPPFIIVISFSTDPAL